jgi:hypothetical protein
MLQEACPGTWIYLALPTTRSARPTRSRFDYHWDTTPVVVGLRPMMAPLVEGAIRADQKDEQQLLARSA